MPETTVHLFNPTTGQLTIATDQLSAALGYSSATPPRQVDQESGVILEQLSERLSVVAGYLLVAAAPPVEDSGILTGEHYTFHCGRLITSRLQGITQLAIFLLTLGKSFDEWVRQLFVTGDPLAGYLADRAGSLLAEQLSSCLEEEISHAAAARSLGSSRRFSPGYCEWNVSEQQQLFQLFPENFCQVRLQPSSLMLPLKSISGIVGIGPEVRKQEYGCSDCHRRECALNRNGMA